MEDEWFIVHLLYQLTLKYEDICVRLVQDTCGLSSHVTIIVYNMEWNMSVAFGLGKGWSILHVIVHVVQQSCP